LPFPILLRLPYINDGIFGLGRKGGGGGGKGGYGGVIAAAMMMKGT